MKEKFRAFEKEYREKIHSILSPAEKVKRNFVTIDGKTYCEGMIRARTNKFQEEIEQELAEFIQIQEIKKKDLKELPMP